MDKIIVLIIFFVLVLGFSAVTTKTDARTTISEVSQVENHLQMAISGQKWNHAATYAKKLAVYYDGKGNYKKASAYYDAAAKYWNNYGKPSWGIVNTIRADHIRTELELYVEQSIASTESLEKFEPLAGTYIGMYPAGKKENWQLANVNQSYQKDHAIFLTYTKWRHKYKDTDTYFPMRYAEKAKAVGAGIQIGWEPSNGLDDVLDDEYVRTFAREAKESGIPIFLRFASEMNGEWVPWSGDPEKYRDKFRLIYEIMREEAPNVAMVWSPNFLPRDNIAPYYPGDDVVDWVGFSLYTIPYSHGKEVPGGNPIDYLRPLYETYKHKPIMISEGAVSHYSYELQKDFSNWASGQIGNMYGFLPRVFPKVKAITYFNLDKNTTNYDNKNNNYDLGDSTIVYEKYRKMIAGPTFLSKVETTPKRKASTFRPIKEAKLSGIGKAFVYVKLPLGKQPYYVGLYQGKRKIGESYRQPWEMNIDFSALSKQEPLTVIAFDRDFKRLAEKQINLN